MNAIMQLRDLGGPVGQLEALLDEPATNRGVKDMREFYAQAARPKELVVVDGADHLFDGKVSEGADAIEDLLGDWEGL